ncbi:arylformamidase [Sporosarcina aquimarina]|uniref:Kynurenine formamidase n=1 Tax=Sporosarcina aquimarina TaxID=114975 RepID=A0ABU4G354_9BACL|nr:arylformamidase [Sporosarcina aquimarina]MDW0111393.1 arylformamidase [Sporosarcina aquimarina]
MTKFTEWIDITQPLSNSIAEWPGDKPFNYELTFTKEQTGSVNIGQVSMSVHTGTHIDAPFHYDNNGQRVHELDLSLYIGPALVIDVTGHAEIGRAELEGFDFKDLERLLLKTGGHPDPNTFPEDYPVLKADIGPFLKERGIRLIGVDVPSVDSVDSKMMDAHHALYDNGVNILENTVLTHVTPGVYELIALPLALQDSDGSPVRAVLRSLEG